MDDGQPRASVVIDLENDFFFFFSKTESNAPAVGKSFSGTAGSEETQKTRDTPELKIRFFRSSRLGEGSSCRRGKQETIRISKELKNCPYIARL